MMNTKRAAILFALIFLPILAVTSIVAINENYVYAQNMTGNMTGNMTAGGNMTGTNDSGSISHRVRSD